MANSARTGWPLPRLAGHRRAEHPGLARALRHHRVCGVVCHFAGAGDVGAAVRNFSQCLPRRGDLRGRFLEFGRERVGHVHFPVGAVALPRGRTFLGYGLLALAALAFVFLAIPETKGKSLEELEHILVRQERLPKQ